MSCLFFGPWLFSDHTIYLSKPRLAERLVLLRWSFMTCTRKKAASRSIFFCRNFAVHVRASHLWIDRKCVATLRCGPEKVDLFELTFFGPHHLPFETATCGTPYMCTSAMVIYDLYRQKCSFTEQFFPPVHFGHRVRSRPSFISMLRAVILRYTCVQAIYELIANL